MLHTPREENVQWNALWFVLAKNKKTQSCLQIDSQVSLCLFSDMEAFPCNSFIASAQNLAKPRFTLASHAIGWLALLLFSTASSCCHARSPYSAQSMPRRPTSEILKSNAYLRAHCTAGWKQRSTQTFRGLLLWEKLCKWWFCVFKRGARLNCCHKPVRIVFWSSRRSLASPVC